MVRDQQICKLGCGFPLRFNIQPESMTGKRNKVRKKEVKKPKQDKKNLKK